VRVDEIDHTTTIDSLVFVLPARDRAFHVVRAKYAAVHLDFSWGRWGWRLCSGSGVGLL
jgi:hypothetical protein